jgi:hypothetical protein
VRVVASQAGTFNVRVARCPAPPPAAPRRLAYNLTLYKHGELLYKGVFAVVRDWLRRELRGIRPTDASTLLPSTKRLYDAHKMYMGMIRDILLYTVRGRASGGGRWQQGRG